MSFNLNTGVNSTERVWKKGVIPSENITNVPKDNIIDKESNKNIPSTTKKDDIKQPNLIPVNEMKNDVEEAFESVESQTEEKINIRGSQVFGDINISNIEVLDEKKIDIEMAPKKISDQNTLKDTADDGNLGKILDNGKVIRNILEPDVKKLVKDLDGTLLKDGVYKKAEKLGKSFVENLDSKSPIATKLSIATFQEKREILVNTVFDVKSKYAETFNKVNDKYESNNVKLNNLSNMIENIVYNSKLTLEEKEKARAVFLETLKKDFPIEHAKVLEIHKKNGNNKHLPNIREMTKNYNIKPSIFSSLPENKQKLIDSMIKGMNSAPEKNTVMSSQNIGLDDNHKLVANNLKPNEAIRLEKYLNEAEKAKGTLNTSVVIPDRINFQGKEYTYDALLGGGGDGIAFSMKSQDGEKIVLKSQIRSNSHLGRESNETNEDRIEGTNNIFREELKPHLHIQEDEKNDKILELKGIVKEGSEIFSITEFAKGGEMCDVTDSINNSNLISDDIKKLVKTSMLKDSIEGLQHMQTNLNMVHYDVKPKNFFVDELGKTKVADFGKSKVGHKGSDDQAEGSEAYSVKFEAPTYKSDIFAMGISIAETLKNKSGTDVREELLDIKKYSGKEPEDHVINAMINNNPDDRPTFTAVLKHSFFDNETLNNPKIKEKLDALVGAVINKDDVKITELNDQIKELLKT